MTKVDRPAQPEILQAKGGNGAAVEGRGDAGAEKERVALNEDS